VVPDGEGGYGQPVGGLGQLVPDREGGYGQPVGG